MKIISQIRNPGGTCPGPQDWPDGLELPEGFAQVPEGMDLEPFYAHNGFVTLTVEDGVVAAMTPDLEAWEAWRASLPPEPDPMETARADKLAELSALCAAAITAGCDVTLSTASGHISLTAEDQINLSTATAAVEQGAAGYPYHLDGQLCAIFPAEDIQAMARAATAHKLYHTTYYNHLAAWVRRCGTAGELAAITYGSTLPEDLAANMAGILSAAGAGGGEA